MEPISREAVRTRRDEVRVEENPFAYNGHFTAWELCKMVLGIVVVPVRFILVCFLLTFMWCLAKLAILGFDESKPMGCFRSMLLWPTRPVARLIMFVFGFYWIDVKGKVAPTTVAPVMVLAPHSTFLDTFLAASLTGKFAGLGKKEARNTPLFGTLSIAYQIIPVDREDPNGRKKALDEFIRRAQSQDGRWPRFAVFPEGTCTNRTALIQFKKGAFAPGVPVQPVIFKWPFRFFDPTWTSSGPSRFLMILRLLSQIYNRASVEFLDVYSPSDEEKADSELYAENVRKVMAEALGVPMTQHSYEDTFLSMAAKKGHFNPSEILTFEFKKVKDLLNLDLKEARRLLKRFGADPKVKKTGRMNAKQFAKALDVPLTDSILEMFELLDTDGVGTIDYKTFLVGLSFISQNTSIDDGIEVLFQALDTQETGKISAESLKQVLHRVFKQVDHKTVMRLMDAADPKKTGFVDKEKFSAFCKENPEMLVVGLRIKERYNETQEPAEVLRKPPKTKQIQVIVESSASL